MLKLLKSDKLSKKLRTLLVISLLLTLTNCGQKGPLYLPKSQNHTQ